jgi:hypothetical protein
LFESGSDHQVRPKAVADGRRRSRPGEGENRRESSGAARKKGAQRGIEIAHKGTKKGKIRKFENSSKRGLLVIKELIYVHLQIRGPYKNLRRNKKRL